MTLYILDTDHLSLFDRRHPTVVKCVLAARKRTVDEIATTVISFEEQLKGRLAQVGNAAANPPDLVLAYERLSMTINSFVGINALNYSADADRHFRGFRSVGIRIGTQDLRIASIVLANGGVLVTRNRRDFEKVPGLFLEDWSVE